MDSLFAEQRPWERVLARAGVRLSRTAWLVVGLTLAGAVLRFYLLGHKSIWLDEAFSIALSGRELDELLRLTVRADTHPPLYYIFLKAWMALGTSESLVRTLSALFSTAAIPVMYLVGQALYRERQAGILAATILAFSPFQIWFAQEARMYAMLTFFVLSSAAFFVRALRENRRGDWAGYALCTTLALYTDNGAIWYVVGVGSFFLLSRRFRARLKPWLLSHALVVLLYGPWLPFLLRQTQQVTESFWLAPPSFQTVLDAFLDFNSFNFPWMALSVLYMTTLFVWAYLVPNGGWQRRLATMWLFVPLIVSLLLSLRQPIFLSRNLIVASLGYYLLVVDTIRKFDSKRATAALLAPLLLMNLVSIGVNAWVEEKEDWRAMAAQVAEAAARRDGEGLILFVPSYAELPFAYYFEQQAVTVETQGYPEDELLLHADTEPVESLEALLAEQAVVWLVLRDVETVDPDWEVKAWLDSNGFVRGTTFEGEEISALTYVRWDVVEGGGARPQTAAPGGDPPGDSEAAPPDEPVAAHSAYLPHVSSAVVVAPTPEPAVHVIAPGDTLWVLARRYGTSVEAIMAANELQSATRLRVGDTLVIPVTD